MSDVYDGPEKQVAQILSGRGRDGLDHVSVFLLPGYTAAVFQIGSKPPQLVISADSGEDTWTINLTPPRDNQSMTISHPDARTVEVVYKNV